jgi:hypothetical protein
MPAVRTSGTGEAEGQGCRIRGSGGTRAPRRPARAARPSRLPLRARDRSPGAAGRSGRGRFARDGGGSMGQFRIPVTRRPCRYPAGIRRLTVLIYSIAGRPGSGGPAAVEPTPGSCARTPSRCWRAGGRRELTWSSGVSGDDESRSPKELTGEIASSPASFRSRRRPLSCQAVRSESRAGVSGGGRGGSPM